MDTNQSNWLAASSALAKEGLWTAASFLERAIASRRGGINPSADRVSQARATLIRLASASNLGPAPTLPKAQLTELRLDIAQLLTYIAMFDARDARIENRPAPAAPVQQLLPLLQTLAALPSQRGHMLRGLAATCVMQPPNRELANAEFELASTPGETTDAAVIAADARNWRKSQRQCE